MLLNVDGPIAGEWVGLLVERNYCIEETVLAPTRRYRGLANADKRAEHEVVIVASRGPVSVTETDSRHDAVSVTPTCETCGSTLTRPIVVLGSKMTLPYRLGARFCSNACRQKAYRERRENQ